MGCSLPVLDPPPATNLLEVSESTSYGVLWARMILFLIKILKRWLETWGYAVTIAEDGEQAWKILQQSITRIVILDWVMPGVDGAQLCHRSCAWQRSYQYILLVTAKDNTEDVVAGLDAGADDYLTKPFERNELRARLRVGQRILTLQDGLIRAPEDLRFQATHDALTGKSRTAAP